MLVKAPVVWMMIWACIPGTDLECRWMDAPIETPTIELRPNVWAASSSICLVRSIVGPVAKFAVGGKYEARLTGCVMMPYGEEPGELEHSPLLREEQHERPKETQPR